MTTKTTKAAQRVQRAYSMAGWFIVGWVVLMITLFGIAAYRTW